jgi:hypothetical protein
MKRFFQYCSEQKFSFDGIAKGKSLEDIAKKHGVSIDAIKAQLKIGTKIEREHTKSNQLAKKIAMDHLWEKPNYYTLLKKVEEDAPVNNVGGGQVAGIAPGEVPPVRLRKKKKKLKKEDSTLAVVNQRWSTPFPYKPFSQ